jgi:hypothetical protein
MQQFRFVYSLVLHDFVGLLADMAAMVWSQIAIRFGARRASSRNFRSAGPPDTLAREHRRGYAGPIVAHGRVMCRDRQLRRCQ